MTISIDGGITFGGGISLGVPPIVLNGLQLYLDAALVDSYPGTGTTWYDLTNNNNNVEMQNSGDISYTGSGGGYFSTGSTGYFSKTSAVNVPTGNTPYTMSIWAQLPTGWPGGSINHTMINIGSAPTYRNFNAFAATFGGYLINAWFAEPSDPPDLVTTTWNPSTPGTNWMNVVVQWNDTTRSIWYNGIQQASQEITTGFLGNNSDLLIGLDYPGFGNYLQGNIGQVLVYNRAITFDEIQQNFNATKSRYGI